MCVGMKQPAFVPDAAWIAAFEAQVTPAVLLYVRRYATWRAHSVARAGGLGDSFYADELVQNALGDILAGVVHWDPAREPLAERMRDTVRNRSRHDRARATRFRHEMWTENLIASMSEDSISDRDHDRAAIGQQALQALRDASQGDREVLKILDAYAAGVVEKVDVLQASGLKPASYTRARKRLRRKTLQLAPELRAAALVT